MKPLVSVVVLVAACSSHGGAQDHATSPEPDVGVASAADEPAGPPDSDDSSRVEATVITAPGGLAVNVEEGLEVRARSRPLKQAPCV